MTIRASNGLFPPIEQTSVEDVPKQVKYERCGTTGAVPEREAESDVRADVLALVESDLDLR
jgi:hypothetical protein